MGFLKENFSKAKLQIKDIYDSALLFLEELKKKTNEAILLFILWGFLFFLPRKWIQYGLIPAILEILFYYFALSLMMGFFRSFFVFLYKKRNDYVSDYYDNFILGIERVSFLVLNITFFFFILYLLNIEVKTFITSISIFAVALVLIFKDYIANMINGMIIMFSPDLNLKEYIKVGEYKGRIINISFLNTEIKTDDGDIIFIPNSQLITEKVTNYSKSNIKKIRYEFKLPLSDAGKLDDLTTYISKGLCKEFEGLITEDNVFIKISTIDKDNIHLILEVTSQKYNFKFEDKVKTTFSKLLVKFLTFESKGIEEMIDIKKPVLTEGQDKPLQ